MTDLSAYSIPKRIWPTSRVPASLITELKSAYAGQALVESADIERRRPPAVVLLTPTDVRERDEDVNELLAMAALGRAVLIGGTDDRRVLTAAINDIGVYRVVPVGVPVGAIANAIDDAHADLELRVALDMLAASLRLETHRLASAIQELQTTQTELLHAERLSTIGRLTGGLVSAVEAHQLVVQRFADVLEETDLDLHRLAAAAVDGTLSVGALLEEIQAYASGRDRRLASSPEDLDAVVRGAVSFARFDELSTDRSLLLDTASGATVTLDRYAIYQVIVNLIRNSLQATRSGGIVEVRTSAEGSDAMIEVEDNGVGMSAEVRTRMFNPFYSTRGDEGLGLGMRNVRSIVDQHGGTVEVQSRVGRGTLVKIRLPAL